MMDGTCRYCHCDDFAHYKTCREVQMTQQPKMPGDEERRPSKVFMSAKTWDMEFETNLVSKTEHIGDLKYIRADIVEGMAEALRFYADQKHQDCEFVDDGFIETSEDGEIARAALLAYEEGRK